LADFYGLNLTYGTLSAACKYVASSATTNDAKHECSKPGFFASENSVVAEIRDETVTGEARNPITYIVEASDDIVYSLGDLEDGVKKGIIRWEEIEAKLRKTCSECPEFEEARTKASDLIQSAGLERDRDRQEALVQAFRSFAIAKIVPSVVEAFQVNYAQIMRGEFHGELVKSCSAAQLIKGCKKIGREDVYPSYDVLHLEIMGRRVIHDLMTLLWEGAENCTNSSDARDFCGKIYRLISPNYRSVFMHFRADDTIPEKYYRLQLVADQISGMTDTFACALHKRLKNG
jgi:dGTPase